MDKELDKVLEAVLQIEIVKERFEKRQKACSKELIKDILSDAFKQEEPLPKKFMTYLIEKGDFNEMEIAEIHKGAKQQSRRDLS